MPYLPRVIGVVTSPSGAVIRDILHRLRDRFPVHVLIWPVAVQGEKCAPEVAAAIAGFNAIAPGGPVPRPDLIIVARGGGSMEDLWGFNEEVVVRAAAASRIPLISAVGHETDTTLIDFASDRRAPTPTAAAEMAVPVRLDLVATLDGQGARLSRALAQGVAQRGQRLRDLARALPRPETLVEQARQGLDLWSERLGNGLGKLTAGKRARFTQAAAHVRVRMLVDLVARLRERLGDRGGRLGPGLARASGEQRRAFARQAARLQPEAITRDIGRKRGELDRLSHRLALSGQAQVAGWRKRLDALERIRLTLGYAETLRRGFAVVRGDDHVVTSKAGAEAAAVLEIEFQDGRLLVGGRAPRKGKPGDPPAGQGSLF